MIAYYGVKFMKKRILTIIMCVASFLFSMYAGAISEGTDSECGLPIVINGQVTEYTSVVLNDTHYLPVRPVFEKIGARVFFRSRDSRILVLSHDGDIIQHVVGTSAITVNGEEKSFPNSSVSENYVTYLPMDMMTAAFRTNAVLIDSQQINIQKPISNTDYGKAVNDALYACNYSNFYPENFKRYINYHINKPDLSMQNVVFTVNLELDIPFYENVRVIANPYDRMVLVNKHNQLPSGFKQNNLVNMDRRYTVSDGKQYLLEKEAYEHFVCMANAARKDGVSIRAVSAYRTEDYQRRLYNKKVRATGGRNADNYSARPGFSEHQTGLAVDINSTKTSFENTAVFKWLQNHAHEYGYILRYPKDKKWITGYEYEPWHYRYVGTEAAKIMLQEGSTYEQYYAKYIAVNEFR